MRPVLLLTAILASAAPPEPAARGAMPLPLSVDPQIARVSGARELPDGRVLLTDPLKPAIYLLDPSTGRATIIGGAGTADGQYVRPGGLYAGPDGSTLAIDRAQTRLLTIDRTGRITGSASIARKGHSSSSDRDADLQRVDSRGQAYFPESMGFSGPDGSRMMPLLRLDPASQRIDTVAKIGLPESKTISGGDGVTFGRRVIGSPEDGWGVAPDGRIAIVRASPYRVEWIQRDGRVVPGPIVDYDPLPITEADRRAFAAKHRGSASVGVAGSGQASAADIGMLFAATWPPFEPDGIVVSPDARVFVARTRAAGAANTIYDVFDAAGRRTARIELPGDSRIVGFGRAAIYVRETAASGQVTLRKYKDS